MQLFSADTIVFLKILFDPENIKETPSKVAHNRPPTFFLCTGPAAQMALKQKLRFRLVLGRMAVLKRRGRLLATFEGVSFMFS